MGAYKLEEKLFSMETFIGISKGDAVAYVKEGKLCINLMAGFVHHLWEYETMYKIIMTMPPLHCSVLQQGFQENT